MNFEILFKFYKWRSEMKLKKKHVTKNRVNGHGSFRSILHTT